jgi:3-hydroxymyristoyl/3-hydroxydecanoyl-(acyl carrier protein) dehydratase
VLHSSTVAVGAVRIILASANLRFRSPVAPGTG